MHIEKLKTHNINFKQNNKMEENKNQQPQGLQIELKPEIGVGVYANLALITHSSSDFILDFTCMLPGLQQPQGLFGLADGLVDALTVLVHSGPSR